MDAQYSDAVQLFVQRSTQAQLTFALTPDTFNDVLELCHLLAGSPLALELAAAWTRLLPIADLKREIERDLDTLSTQVKRSERHGSMRAVFEYTWKLLSPQEQTLFKQLSVFRGGFTREAVAKVTGASVVALASLVDKSLLRVQASGRFERHPLVFQYGQEKLEAEPERLSEMRERHLEYFLALAKEAQSRLREAEQKVWLDRLEQDHDNFRIALDYSLDYADPESALELSGNLVLFWEIRSHWNEGRAWLEKAVANSVSPTKARAKALTCASRFAQNQGDYDIASRYLRESVDLARKLQDQEEIIRSLNMLAAVYYHLRDIENAAICMEEVITLSRELDDKPAVAFALNNLSLLAHRRGEFSEAYALQQQSIELSEELGDKKQISTSLHALGETAVVLKNYSAAQDAYQKSLAIAEEIDLSDGVARCLYSLGILALSASQYNEAYRHFARSLSIQQKLGSPSVFYVLSAFVRLYAEQGQWIESVRLLAALESLEKSRKMDINLGEGRAVRDQVHARTRAKSQLSEEDYIRAVAEGSRMTLDETINYILSSVESADIRPQDMNTVLSSVESADIRSQDMNTDS